MKIALVTPYALPESGAPSLRMDSMKNFLIKAGHHVTILAPWRTNVNTSAHTIRYHSLGELSKILGRNHFEVVLGTSPPMTHSFVALLACKWAKIPFILDLRDPWILNAHAIGLYSKTNPKYWFYRGIEKTAYRLADSIFCVTDALAQQVISDGASSAKTTEIPNGTNAELFRFDPIERKKIRDDLGLSENEPLGVYAGSIQGWDIEKFLQTIAKVLLCNPGKLLFLLPSGDSAEKNRELLQPILKSTGLTEKIIVLNSPPVQEVFRYFSAGDFGIVVIPDSLYYCIRVKTFDYPACGLRVLAKAPLNGTLHELLQKKDIGIFCSSWQEFEKNFEMLLSNALPSESKRILLQKKAIKWFNRDLFNAKAEKIMVKLYKGSN